MQHMWLMGVLVIGLLAGMPEARSAAQVPDGDTVLGTVTLPRAVLADGKPLARGQYQLRLTTQAAQPTVPGQKPDLNRWVEFVQAGQVRGREVVSIIPSDEMQQLFSREQGVGTTPAPARVELLRGGEYLRVWVTRAGVTYLLHLPVQS